MGKKGEYLPPHSFEKKKLKEKEETVYEIAKNEMKGKNKSREVVANKTEANQERT